MKMMEKEADQVANMTFADPILRMYEFLVPYTPKPAMRGSVDSPLKILKRNRASTSAFHISSLSQFSLPLHI